MLRQLGLGVRDLWRGARYWSGRPKLMLLGILPAVVVFSGLAVLLVGLASVAPAIATWITPLPRGWDDQVRSFLRAALTLAIMVGGVALALVLYAALTLALGAPIYERISRVVDAAHGGIPAARPRPLVAQFADALTNALRMLVTAAGLGLGVTVVGLVPLVGTAGATALGAVMGARVVADELASIPCDARGLTVGERRRLLRRSGWRVLGFGLSCYLVFLVPGGAIVLMPAAVAGATLLTRDLLGEPT
ncbi:MAG TPA: EI24 domain-containing protein [Propionibacteriaceae bacterium]|nr:EI24 domain-containing protein [Propionibacteriaceae bacterium]